MGTPSVTSAPGGVRRRTPIWPIWILAMPAAVSIWAGWVGLGQMTGFGVVQLLPGIWDELRINTSITLPIGMEAYAAYALYVWLGTDAPTRAKDFARVSALGALALGALGQMAYHLMAAAHVESAPWQITAAVSCLPVGVLGMAAALAHLVRSEEDARDHANHTAYSAPTPAPVTPSLAQPFPATTSPAPAPAGAPMSPPLRAVPNWSSASWPQHSTPPGRPADRPDERTDEPDRTSPTNRTDHSPSGRPEDTGPVRPTTRTTGRTQPTNRTDPTGRPDRTGRSDTGSTRSRSARRARKRTGRPRTDAELAEAVRELAEANGGQPPSQYQLKQRFGIGTSRAARLLADLHTTQAASRTAVQEGADQ